MKQDPMVQVRVRLVLMVHVIVRLLLRKLYWILMLVMEMRG